jgi:hypothetical protein
MMRSKAVFALVSSLAMLTGIAIAKPKAPADDAQYHHSEAVMSALTRQCDEGIGNDAFCECAVDAVNMYLPPQYASLLSVSLGDGSTLQIFDLHGDIPRHIEDKLDNEVLHCRERFTHGRQR